MRCFHQNHNIFHHIITNRSLNRFWLLFILLLITIANSTNTSTPTSIPTPVPTPDPTPNPTPNPIANPIALCCDCITVQPTSGCSNDTICADEICNLRSFCCDNEWNTICARVATIACRETSCCECIAPTPGIAGCSADIQCEAAICNLIDPTVDTASCCNTEWNTDCATLATSFCILNSYASTTSQPTYNPTFNPITTQPTDIPSTTPTTYAPSATTTDLPTSITNHPTLGPTPNPTPNPTPDPTPKPSLFPIQRETLPPIYNPTSNPTAYPTPNPTPYPTPNPRVFPIRYPSPNDIRPTEQPSITYNIPFECSSLCDAFSVTVQEYRQREDTVYITYKISRLFGNGECKKSVQYIVLGLCDEDIEWSGCTESDLNGLIEGFALIERERSDSSDSADDNTYRYVWGSHSDDSLIGIRVNVEVNEEILFNLSLKNVFLNERVFSGTVRFRRGAKEFNCYNKGYLSGLPCLDLNKFILGGYESSGYNEKYRKYGGNKEKSMIGAESANIIKEENDNETFAQFYMSLDPYIRWSLLSVLFVFGIMVIVCTVCILKHRINEIHTNNEKNKDSLDIDHKHNALSTNDNHSSDEEEIDLTFTNMDETSLDEHSLVQFQHDDQ